MRWKTFQRIYRELVAENNPKNQNIIIRYVGKDRIKGSIVCKLQEFKKYAWTIYEKSPIIVVIGLEEKGKQDIRQAFKYILCANLEVMPNPNDNFCVKCFSLMNKKSKDTILELLIRQIYSYIGDTDDPEHPSY